MRVKILKKEQFISGKKLEEVFDFFKKPENLSKITPSALGFEILTPFPIRMERGRIIDYQIKILGVSQRWRSIITDYNPPHRFVDEQLMGPYSFWHHTHEFKEQNGGTLITDEVRYGVPFGFLGELMGGMFVEKQLQHIFDYRSKIISQIFQ